MLKLNELSTRILKNDFSLSEILARSWSIRVHFQMNESEIQNSASTAHLKRSSRTTY